MRSSLGLTEEGKWFVSNKLLLTRPNYVGRTVKYFMVNLFFHRENQVADLRTAFCCLTFPSTSRWTCSHMA